MKILMCKMCLLKWAEENAKEGIANLALDCVAIVAIHSNSIHGLRL